MTLNAASDDIHIHLYGNQQPNWLITSLADCIMSEYRTQSAVQNIQTTWDTNKTTKKDKKKKNVEISPRLNTQIDFGKQNIFKVFEPYREDSLYKIFRG